MNLPDHITRQQITDAFALLGLDAGEVVSLSWENHRPWIAVQTRPANAPTAVTFVAAHIPILERAPEPDLVALARQEARE